MLFGFLSGSEAVNPSLGFITHNSQVEPPTTEISLQHFSCCQPSQPSCVSSSLPTGHVVVKWFLLSVLGYKSSLQLVFSWLFWMISLQFSSEIPYWSWEEVSIASTYSFYILDPNRLNVCSPRLLSCFRAVSLYTSYSIANPSSQSLAMIKIHLPSLLCNSSCL